MIDRISEGLPSREETIAAQIERDAWEHYHPEVTAAVALSRAQFAVASEGTAMRTSIIVGGPEISKSILRVDVVAGFRNVSSRAARVGRLARSLFDRVQDQVTRRLPAGGVKQGA